MKNKVLIKLIVPEINANYDLFIPVNELIWRVNKLLVKAINELSGDVLDVDRKYSLINVYTSMIYKNNEIIINTDIRNGTQLILLSS